MPRTGMRCSGGGSAASYAAARPGFWVRPRLATEGRAGVAAVHPGDGAGDRGDAVEPPVVEQHCPAPEHRRFGPLSALRAHTKAPHKTDFHRKALRALDRPGTARTEAERVHSGAHRVGIAALVLRASSQQLLA
jgi:hypothetical protein